MKKAAAPFCALVILALWLRLCGLTFDSLWLDEGYQSMVDAYGCHLSDTLVVPARPFIQRFDKPGTTAAVLRNFRRVDPLCPPLYAVLLNKWICQFGGDDTALRSFSVILSICCLSAVYWLSYAFWGGRTALCAGLLEAFSPFDIYYGQEVRMYALLALTATISCGALMILLFKDPPRSWRWITLAIYAVSAWAMINSHYTGLFVLAYQVAAALAVIGLSRNWRLFRRLICGWLAVVLLWSPWIGLFQQAAAIRTAAFYVARQPSWWWPFMALFFRIPANWIVFLAGKQVVAYATPVFATAALLLALALLVLPAALGSSARAGTIAFLKPSSRQQRRTFTETIAGSLRWVNSREGKRSFLDLRSAKCDKRPARNALVFLWMWAIGPALALWFMDVVESHRVIEISRYTMATAPAVYILAGLGAACLNWRNRWVQLFLLLHLAFAEVNNIAHVTRVYQREPWRNMANTVQRLVPTDQLVLIAEYYDIACLDRYLKTPYRQVGVGVSIGQAHLDNVLNGVSRFALITAQDGESITGMIPARFALMKQVNMEHGLHLRLFRCKTTPGRPKLSSGSGGAAGGMNVTVI